MISLGRLACATQLLAARAALLLMLVIASSHAIAPVYAPLERVRGSAFSAATADVSTVAPPVQVAAERIAALSHKPELVRRVGAQAGGAPRQGDTAPYPATGPPFRGLLSSVIPNGPPAS